jgi:hypothetical protein
MSAPRRHASWSWRVAALVLALLTLGIGLCLFDDDGTDTDCHAVGHDLCGGFLGSLAAVTLLALAAVSRVLAEPALAVSPITPYRLDPPPRLLLPS